MIRHRVAVFAQSFLSNNVLLSELEKLPITVHRYQGKASPAEVISFLNRTSAEIALVGREPFNDHVLNSCERLRFISKYGVGLDNLDLNAMDRLGIRLGWTAGVNRRSVAELVLTFMLAHFRNVSRLDRLLKAGTWLKNGGRQLNELAVGIVGLGNIGTELAKLLGPFGCHLLYCDIADRALEARQLGARQASFDELLNSSDVITFHVPLTDRTKLMLNRDSLEKVKPEALVINTARGEIVDFEVICKAVGAGKIGGFAADVFPEEPCDLSRFRDRDNLYFTPHIGGNSVEAVLAMGRSAIEHIRSYIQRA